jgi:hypothetical protein
MFPSFSCLFILFHFISFLFSIALVHRSIPDLVGYYDPGDEHISKVMVRGAIIPMLAAFALFMALDLLIASK